MKKSDYKLFFYIGDKPVNINLKDINFNPNQSTNEIKIKLLNQDNQKNLYNKAKQNYDFYLKRNKNILLLNKKSISGKITSKDYLENKEIFEKENKKDGLSLLPFVPNKKENNKNIDELKKLQRNTVTMRRIEYSMKVKNETNKKRFRNNIRKIIIIQKWVRGFLLRNLLSNLSYFEMFTNEFLDHIKKFIFLKHAENINNVIKYFENKIIIQEEKKKKISNNNNNVAGNNKSNDNNKNIKGLLFNKNEGKSYGDGLNNNKKSLDIIKENSNERYIDEDSIMEYNNRNKNKINNDLNNNILFLSSKDFSDKHLINSNNNFNNFNNNDSNSNILLSSNNNNNNNTPFVLNESSIVYEEANKKREENNSNKKNNKNDTLNSNKEDIFSTLKNEEVRDVFNAKHCNNLVKPSPSLINNIINNENDANNNKELFIKRPKLNRKFIEEISSAQSSTPLKSDISEITNDENIFKKIENNFLNNSNEENINFNNKESEKKMVKENNKDSNIKLNNYIKKEIVKDLPIGINEKNNKYVRKINYINSIKSNQFGSISNPTNTTKENTSTLDSNTLNVNRKLILDENISITNNNRTVLEARNNYVKPINKPMVITKIRIKQDKNNEYLIIRYSKSEKKSLPKIFDISYQYSKEINEETNNNIINIENKINNNINENLNIENCANNINIENNNNNLDNININEINKSLSNDININVLNVVNNNVDELNSSIKNIVKEEIQIDNNQNKLNPFGKSIRALLDLDKPINNDNEINEIENNIINKEEEKEEINDNNLENENKENQINVLNQMSIEEIKEVKEEYEDEKESELNFTQKKLYNSNDVIETSKENDNILDCNKNLVRKSSAKIQKNNDYMICSQNICYNIIQTKNKNNFDKTQIFLLLLLVKQIKFNVKPYIFNLLKKFWTEKIKK